MVLIAMGGKLGRGGRGGGNRRGRVDRPEASGHVLLKSADSLPDRFHQILLYTRLLMLMINDRYQQIEMRSYNNGREEYSRQKYPKAINFFTSALTQDPSLLEAYIYRGLSYQASSRLKQAEEDYSKVLEKDQSNLLALFNRASVRKKRGNLHFAYNDFSSVIQLQPNYTQAYLGRASVSQELNHHQEAKQDYSEAINLDQTIAPAYVGRGLANEALEQERQAILDYSQAIQLNPNSALPFYNRAALYQQLQYYQQSLQDYDSAILLQPRDAQAYYNRGIVNYALGNHQEAIADNSKAIQFDPENSMAFNNRAIARQVVHQDEQALKDYNQAIELNPKDSSFFNNRALLHRKLNNYRAADSDLNSAIGLSPQHPIYFCNRAQCCLETNHRPKAKQYLDKSIRSLEKERDQDLIQQFGLENDRILEMRRIIKNKNRLEVNLRQVEKKAERQGRGAVLNEAKVVDDQLQANTIQSIFYVQYWDEWEKHRKQELREEHLRIQEKIMQLLRDQENSPPAQVERNSQAEEEKPVLQVNKINITENSNPQPNRDNSYEEYSFEQSKNQRFKEKTHVFQRKQQQLYYGKDYETDNFIEEKNSYYPTARAEQTNNNFRDNTYNMEYNQREEEVAPERKKQILEENLKKKETFQSHVLPIVVKGNNQSKFKHNVFTSDFMDHVLTQYSKVKREVNRIEPSLLQDSDLAQRLQELPQDSRLYYQYLFSFLLNHFLTYKVCFTVFFAPKPEKECQFISAFNTLSLVQPISGTSPGFGVLVQTPFQILEAELFKQPNPIIRNISYKVGASYLKTYRYVQEAVAFTCSQLLSDQKFNSELRRVLEREDKAHLKQIWRNIAKGRDISDSKKLKSIIGNFSFTEQLSAAHMTLITVALEQMEYQQFIRISDSKAELSTFIRESLQWRGDSLNSNDFGEQGAKKAPGCCQPGGDCTIM